MPPVMQATVSLSPPMEMALRMASSKSSASRAQMIACGTVPAQLTSNSYHSRMLFTVNALPRAEFDEWLASKAPGGVSSVMDDSADEAAADETNSDETTSDAEATDSAAASRGQELFFANGCNICHGDNGEGGLGPTIASTGLTIDQVVQQYRSPLAAMPAFPEDRISDEQVGDIYAWLQTLPLPANIVPGEGTP